MLAASSWLNQLYHIRPGADLEGVDLSVSLSYADRFRIRHPGGQWDRHPPHVDGRFLTVFIYTLNKRATYIGGAIERWEDETFRKCFTNIFDGKWDQHDPYDLEGRLNARTSLYGRAGQVGRFFCFYACRR